MGGTSASTVRSLLASLLLVIAVLVVLRPAIAASPRQVGAEITVAARSQVAALLKQQRFDRVEELLAPHQEGFEAGRHSDAGLRRAMGPRRDGRLAAFGLPTSPSEGA